MYPTKVAWDGGINLHLKSSSSQPGLQSNILKPDGGFAPITISNNNSFTPDVAKGWSWATTNVPFAHSVATGKGVKVAVIDSGAFIINHPDMQDKSGKSRYELDTDKNYNDFTKCISLGCDPKYKTLYNHGNACVMTGYAKENTVDVRDYTTSAGGDFLFTYGTVGVAPEATVVPYHEQFPLGWADAVQKLYLLVCLYLMQVF